MLGSWHLNLRSNRAAAGRNDRLDRNLRMGADGSPRNRDRRIRDPRCRSLVERARAGSSVRGSVPQARTPLMLGPACDTAEREQQRGTEEAVLSYSAQVSRIQDRS